MPKESKILNYQCKDCNHVFQSDKSKIDVVCESCEGLHVDYSTNEITEKKNTVLTPARAAYYTQLVENKFEENNNLKEQRGWLLEQVYYLRKTVGFLEARKIVLEAGIKNMEKNILGGVSAIEQMEENNNFQNLSPHIKKKNQ